MPAEQTLEESIKSSAAIVTEISRNPREIVKTNIPRVTISSVADLIGCPRKFADTRIQRNWSDAPIDNVERGKCLHAVMREIYTQRQGGDVPMFHLEAIVDRQMKKARWSESCDKAEEKYRISSMARALVEADDWEDVAGTVGLEAYIEYDLYHQGRALVKISARLDRVLVRESEPRTLVVRDYKSGAIRIDLAETYVMLRAAKHKWQSYDRYLLEVDGFDSEGRVVRETVDYAECRDQHDLFRTRAAQVLLDGYDKGEWPACPGDRCTFCRIREQCQGLSADDIDNF